MQGRIASNLSMLVNWWMKKGGDDHTHPSGEEFSLYEHDIKNCK
jgi:hypothetical protein